MSTKPVQTDRYGNSPERSFESTSKKMTYRRVPVASPWRIIFKTCKLSALSPDVKSVPTPIPNRETSLFKSILKFLSHRRLPIADTSE